MGNGIIYKKQSGVQTCSQSRKITVIPYERWLYSEAKRWGHFKQFNPFSTNTDDLNVNTPTSSNLSSSSLSSSFVSSSLTPTSSIPSTDNTFSKTTNPRNRFSNNDRDLQLSGAPVGSSLSSSQLSNSVNGISCSSASLVEKEQLQKPIYYINGRFFKTLTRLGDSQFILSEYGQDDIILTIPSNIERYRTNDNAIRDRILRLNRVIGCCDEFIVFQLWKGNNEVEIFIFDYSIESTAKKDLKCTCNQSNIRCQSPSVRLPKPKKEIIVSATPPINRHSALMQSASLSAYHVHNTDARSLSFKSFSMLNATFSSTTDDLDDANQTMDINKQFYAIDNIRKASFLTGSARCTLTVGSSNLNCSISPNVQRSTSTVTNNNSRFSPHSLLRFSSCPRKLISLSNTTNNNRNSSANNTRSYSLSNTNELLTVITKPSNCPSQNHRSTPYLASLTCPHHTSSSCTSWSDVSTRQSSPTTVTTTLNNRIVRKVNSLQHRFNARSYTCLISPDHSHLLITPDYEDKHSYSHQTHSDVTIILNVKYFTILRITPARYDQRFAFDPRYGHSRLAEFDTVRGQITDIKQDRVLVCSNHTLKTKVYRVEYTNDGYLIIVLCTLPIFQRVKRNYFLYILNSSTLLHTRSIIDYRGPFLSSYVFTNEFSLLFNIYPSLSNCGSTLAVLKNIEPSVNVRIVELYSLPYTCVTLKEITRRHILRYVDQKHVQNLFLPENLKAYLSYKHKYY
ncbi:unnamed protein product [Didymodactylos carnosus]|uniref:SOCS box domain-containing protein n=1 Tax=Didymodactylos carnosus TaxID=1234261 RepID=A0A813NHS5_9BILA|nr:unnamed protein product [Didymodactylos carnosus]CAF3518015.1 unnamed protein product [Didymodactylos carnosus]